MIRSLLATRLSRLQLAAVTAVSVAASVIIVADATSRPDLNAELLAALHRAPVVHHVTPKPAPVIHHASSGPKTTHHSSTPSSSPAPSPAPAATPAPSPAPAPAPTPTTTTTTTTTPTTTPKPLKVKHVFVIALTTPSYQDAFGQGSTATYLNDTLRKKGTLLSGYQTLGPQELPDYLAMVSGQAPNPDTRSECVTYADFPTKATPNKAGLLAGDGCVYPDSVLTIGDQVTAAGNSWKAYIEDQGKLPCIHPNDGAVDNVQLAGAGPDYETRHNPFIYFHSLLDLGDCSTDDVDLGKLAGALKSPGKTPSYSYIAPGICEDAAPPATCPTTSPTGIEAEDAFLKQVVPEILASPAYKQDGALIIAFAASGAPAALKGPVQTGALVLSPYAHAGRTLSATYGPYSLLRTVEDIFAFKPLGAAATAKSFAQAALPSA